MVATSPLSALMGGGGDPPPRNLSSKMSLDVRDALTGLISRGHMDLKSDEAKGYASAIRYALGDSAAQKLITQAMIFNQRSDVKGLPADRRVQNFYSMGSQDAGTHAIIQRLGSLGYGAVSGLANSPDLGNMIASRRDTTTGPGAGTANTQQMGNTMASIR